MLIYAMTVTADGFVADPRADFDWAAPSDELIQFHSERVGALGGYLLGRRLYETMLVWETEPSMRRTEDGAAFADIWSALPKVVFTRTLKQVQGNARIASAPLNEEVVALGSPGADVEIGGSDLAHQAIRLDLVDEFRIFRAPLVAGSGTPYLPRTTRPLALDLVESRAFGPIVYERYCRNRRPLG